MTITLVPTMSGSQVPNSYTRTAVETTWPRMGLRRWLLARTYERRMRDLEQAGLGALRAQLLTLAHGDALEIGAGAGSNLPLYPTTVSSLTLSEPDPTMERRLQRRTATGNQRVSIVRAAADALPFDDASFDTIVSTLVLCGVPNQQDAVLEMKRVLKPGGTLLVLEHVRSTDPHLAQQQERYNRLNRFFTGCNCNRTTQATLQHCGFNTTALRGVDIPGAPALVRPAIIGAVTRPSE